MTVCDRGRGVKNKNSVTYFMDSPWFGVQCFSALTCFENRLVGVVYTNNFCLIALVLYR